MKVLVLGATGFVGTHLTRALERRGDVVIAGSLRDPLAAAAVAQSCDAIVNLAGEPVAQRWTATVKHAILYSRTELPRRLLHALSGAARRPASYVSASAIGFYGTSETQTFVEASPPGSNFLAHVCEAWERQALAARDLGMRVVLVRTGVALGAGGGALKALLPVFRLGLGGPIASGRQWFSWIHIDDLVGIYVAALDGGEGPYNATAPNPVANAQFAHALGRALHRPAFLRAPSFALEMALGEGASTVTEGQRVLPERTIRERRYDFAFSKLDGALEDLV